MTQLDLPSKTFDWQSQKAFSSASGDDNPIHMDPVVCRRTQVGFPVVHGIHGVLWALDCLIAKSQISKPIARIRVRFNNYIYVEDTVGILIKKLDENSLRFALHIGDTLKTTVEVTFGAAQNLEISPLSSAPKHHRKTPFNWNPSEHKEFSGRQGVNDAGAVQQLFPALAEAMGHHRTTGLMALSTIVGMACPGYHSLFNSLDVLIHSTSDNIDGVTYRIKNFSQATGLLDIGIAGCGLSGSIKAFYRSRPVEQPPFTELLTLVEKGEFRLKSSLIVGGSRGLGALTAKILAAGGGRVIISYSTGKTEAQKITREINDHCKENICSVLKLDVQQDMREPLSSLPIPVDHFYYFATPHISRQKGSLFSKKLFDEFYSYYVDGFYNICQILARNTPDKITAFYPSTTYVDNRPNNFCEYAMAKSAGEILCHDISQFAPNIYTIMRRLPPLLTDQTLTMFDLEASSAVQEVYSAVKQLHQTAKG